MNDYVSVMMSVFGLGWAFGFSVYIVASLFGYALRSVSDLIKRA